MFKVFLCVEFGWLPRTKQNIKNIIMESELDYEIIILNGVQSTFEDPYQVRLRPRWLSEAAKSDEDSFEIMRWFAHPEHWVSSKWVWGIQQRDWLKKPTQTHTKSRLPGKSPRGTCQKKAQKGRCCLFRYLYQGACRRMEEAPDRTYIRFSSFYIRTKVNQRGCGKQPFSRRIITTPTSIRQNSLRTSKNALETK